MSTHPLSQLILTNKQYSEHPFAKDSKRDTYVYEIAQGNKKILYFGSTHTNNPSHPMFTEIKRLFDEIKPDLVYIEGYQAVNTDKDAIRKEVAPQSVENAMKEGESHFTLKLAVDAGIDFMSPEPSRKEEVDYVLSKGFSKSEVFSYYMYRMISQYQRMNAQPTKEGCTTYMQNYIKRFKQYSEWDQKDVDVLEKELLANLRIEDVNFYKRQVDPIPWEGKPYTAVNQISAHSGDFRDMYIFEKIVDGLKTHNRLFIVFGSAHAVRHEPAIRALMANLL